MKRITIVIPILNEEKVLSLLVEKLDNAIFDLRSEYLISYLFVLDPSYDNSEFVLLNMCKLRKDISMLKLSRNFGHQVSLVCGIKESDSDIVITLDGDLQHPPDLIPVLINRYENGFKIVNTSRKQSGSFMLKSWLSKLFYNLLNILSDDVSIIKSSPDFRLISDEPLKIFRNLEFSSEPFIRGTIPQLGFPSTVVEYEESLRESGQSKYSFNKKLSLSLNALLTNTDIFLKLAIRLAFIFITMSIGLSIYSLYQYKFGSIPSGWTTGMIIFLSISSIQLLFLGYIGTHVSRSFKSNQKLPLYIVEKRYN